jgi:putative membrane protein
MRRDHLIYGDSKFPASLTLITAVILLIIGISAIVGMIMNIGPF